MQKFTVVTSLEWLQWMRRKIISTSMDTRELGIAAMKKCNLSINVEKQRRFHSLVDQEVQASMTLLHINLHK